MAGFGILNKLSNSSRTPFASKPNFSDASIKPNTLVPFLSVPAYWRIRAIGNSNL